MFAVFRQRNYILLWIGQVVSLLGDWVLLVALPFYIYQRTGSALATGVMFVVETLPRLFLGSLAGVVAISWHSTLQRIGRPPWHSANAVPVQYLLCPGQSGGLLPATSGEVTGGREE